MPGTNMANTSEVVMNNTINQIKTKLQKNASQITSEDSLTLHQNGLRLVNHLDPQTRIHILQQQAYARMHHFVSAEVA